MQLMWGELRGEYKIVIGTRRPSISSGTGISQNPRKWNIGRESSGNIDIFYLEWKVSEETCRGNRQGWPTQRRSVGSCSVSPMVLLWLKLWRWLDVSRSTFPKPIQDYENVDDVNRQLERMGYNIGVRIIEDFLARTGSGRCTDFRDTSEKVPKLLMSWWCDPWLSLNIHMIYVFNLGAASVQDILECDSHSHELVIGKEKVICGVMLISRQVTSFPWSSRQIPLLSLLNCRTITPILNTATSSVVRSGE